MGRIRPKRGWVILQENDGQAVRRSWAKGQIFASMTVRQRGFRVVVKDVGAGWTGVVSLGAGNAKE